MAAWAPSIGQTILVPSGPNGEKHLFVIIYGPNQVPSYGAQQQLILVNFTSAPTVPGVPFDQTCIIGEGVHSFISHQSFAAFRHMRIDNVAHVQNMVNQGVWIPHDPIDHQVVQSLQAGVCNSKLTPREFKKIFQCPR